MMGKPKNPDAIKTGCNQQAILFGNGINRIQNDLNGDYSWSNLLFDLNREFGKSVKNIKTKPFPMVYDEILHKGVRENRLDEHKLKKYIKEKVGKLRKNHRYNNLTYLQETEILTTNYDYLLEKGFDASWKRKPTPRDSRFETFYSLYRKQNSDDKTIWHIHGEQGDQRSILLGFRHYINYTSKIKAQAEKFVFDARKKKAITDSWVNKFFTHNIKIIGLGLETTEYPIWWLLSYRDYVQNRYADLIVNNKIDFIIPKFPDDIESDKSQLLKGYGINIEPINVAKDDYDSFYQKALKMR